MTKGITEKEPDPKLLYADIIGHSHWQSPTREHMSLYDRAAQFSSFDALAGYSDMVQEEARVTDSRVHLEEEERERLNQKLNRIAVATENGEIPTLTIIYFLPDERKAGGSYETITEQVKKIDQISRQIILKKTVGLSERNAAIPIDDVIALQGELIQDLDDPLL